MLRRVGRPGLLGTVARTAAITGTASVVHRSISRAADRRAEDRAAADAYYAQQARPLPAAAESAAEKQPDLTAELERLGKLHASGVLSDAEFAVAKAKLLG